MEKTIKVLSDKLTTEQLQSIKKILIIQQKPFGDILLNTGYFAELRKHFREAQIDFLIQKPYITILADNPHLDDLVIIEKPKGWISFFIMLFKTISKIRNTRYDLIIDQLRGTSSVRFVLFSGARYKLGYKLKPKKWLFLTFNRWNSVYNLKAVKGPVRYYSRMKFDLLKPLGIEEVEHNLEYIVKPESVAYIKKWLSDTNLLNKDLVVISPGTPVKRKQWDLKNYALFADLIKKNIDAHIILLWGPGEKVDVEYIHKNMETSSIIATPTTFNQAGALLQFATILVGNDGGINHLAVSQNTPSLAIFGSTSSPKKWCASHKSIHSYIRNTQHKNRLDNTFGITPDEVFNEFKVLYKSIKNKNV